ncbi:hypothetical protein NR800_37840 [Corallococcus interemptor]|uniref:hypothetical protein n=1 Tax=Corallococcus TaxID=83461 RepID=UPI001CBD6D9E|nr:hypothetical protein [Corallococcus sp. AS-1-12]MBZ4329797.1 hypothetical protein [Corallococcus sp. AS-1-12]
MPKLVLVGAELFPHLRDLLRAEALRAGFRAVEVPVRAWGATTTPWVEVKGGRFRAGLLGPEGREELEREDVFWCLSEGPLPPEEDYLRAEREALREGFHTTCPARTLNRRGLLSVPWTVPSWRLLAQQLPAREGACVLAPPHFHVGTPPEDGRRWKPWPQEAGGTDARVWWTVSAPGPLHMAWVMGQQVSLWSVEDGGGTRVAPTPELAADLARLAAGCGAEFLEVLLVPSASPTAWAALQLSFVPEGLESMLSGEHPALVEQVEHFVRARLAGQEVGP